MQGPSAEKVRLRVRLIERIVGISCGTLFLAICLGCMSLNFGGRTEVMTREDGPGPQGGKVRLACGEELDVYYPLPYVSPPNLETERSSDDVRVVEQRADHFRIQNTSLFSRELTWTARGVTQLTCVPTQTAREPVLLKPVPSETKRISTVGSGSSE